MQPTHHVHHYAIDHGPYAVTLGDSADELTPVTMPTNGVPAGDSA